MLLQHAIETNPNSVLLGAAVVAALVAVAIGYAMDRFIGYGMRDDR